MGLSNGFPWDLDTTWYMQQCCRMGLPRRFLVGTVDGLPWDEGTCSSAAEDEQHLGIYRRMWSNGSP